MAIRAPEGANKEDVKSLSVHLSLKGNIFTMYLFASLALRSSASFVSISLFLVLKED